MATEPTLSDLRRNLNPFRRRCMAVLTEFAAAAQTMTDEPVFLGTNLEDKTLFKAWNLWIVCVKHSISIAKAAPMLITRYRNLRFVKKRERIGTQLKILLSPPAVAWLDKELAGDLTGNRESRKMALRLSATLNLVSGEESSDPADLALDYARQQRTISKRRRELARAARTRPYRGNPWI